MPAVKLLEISGGRQRLDRYELVAELASGGMATVFLGRIVGVGGFQRFVAIKRLHPHLAHEEEFVEMFLDEARLAAGIHHPNVVPILEVGTSERGYYLVMEYIEGDTLARLLARAATIGERIPVPIVIRIILDTLAGLHAAHELKDDHDEATNLVHRDVSPQNILVGIDGTSRITDFGVARAASRLSSTRAGQLKGKLAYMAPEQAKGGDVDRRADLFALGTVLWEVLAGRRLFKGEGEADTLNRVLFEPIPLLREHAPHISPGLASVTMRALDRDPDQRHATAAEFGDALERAARPTQQIASVRDVASYVQKVLGQEISQQRDAVRAWLAKSEPSRTQLGESGPTDGSHKAKEISSVSSAAISLPPHMVELADSPDAIDVAIDMAPDRRRALIGGAIALTGVVALGLFLWAANRNAPVPAVSAVGAGAATVAVAPTVSPKPAPPQASGASVAAPASSADSAAAPAAAAAPAVPPVRVWALPAAGAPAAAPVRRARPVAAPPPNPGDDIPHNPYR